MDLTEVGARGSLAPAARHPWELARLDVVERLIAAQVELADGALAIDVGCGDTFVAAGLSRRFPAARVCAVDPAFTDAIVADLRRQAPAVSLFHSLDAAAAVVDRPAALVLLMDVLEHVDDDRALLRDLARRPFVDARTRLLITVPAYQALFCSHDVFLGHRRRYSGRRLRATVEASGLEVIDSGSIFSTLVPLRLLQVLAERLMAPRGRAATTGLVTWNGGPVRTQILRRLLRADAAAGAVLRRAGVTLPGLSIFALCRTSV
jgi:SAM-dependent methyltransferase